jgi:hypothetical protein
MHDLAPNSCVNLEVQVFNRILDKLKNGFQNLSVVTVDSDRDPYARHGLHLNAQGKEHAVNRVAAVIKDLFSLKTSLLIALNRKENGDMQSYSAVKQSPCAEEVNVSGCDKMSQPQLYRNCDSVDQNECDVITKLSEENHVQTGQVSQESIGSVMVGEQVDLSCESINPRGTEVDHDKQEMTALPSKRTQLQLQKRNKYFYGRSTTSDCLKFQ